VPLLCQRPDRVHREPSCTTQKSSCYSPKRVGVFGRLTVRSVGLHSHCARPAPGKEAADSAGLTAGDLRAGHRAGQRRARRDDTARRDPAADAGRPARADGADRTQGAAPPCPRLGTLAPAVARGSLVRHDLRRRVCRVVTAGAGRSPSRARSGGAASADRGDQRLWPASFRRSAQSGQIPCVSLPGQRASTVTHSPSIR